MAATERIGALCARLGICSRNEAVKYVKLGLVLVNGEPVKNAADLVASDADVTLADRGKRMQAEKVTLMLHKPLHYASCRAKEGQPLARRLLVPNNRAMDCKVKYNPKQLAKLDAVDMLGENTAGLLLFSQDGRVSGCVSQGTTIEGSAIEQEFELQLPNDATQGSGASESQLAALRAVLSGICSDPSEDGQSPSDVSVSQIDASRLWVVFQGAVPSAKVHQACSLAGLRGTSVTRTRIGGVRLGTLPSGQWTAVRKIEEFLLRWPS
eukprot:TRINITY_DN51193_c0_g1_i1.p1 TRINITY_DN51193_c0_g1~~TRINITY_DN51193_c0_g1_i1.p1  ORF type:complete len:267 (+),score=34.75 TRINITY_DN51193_c0_g1_i1:93-893(+)